MADDDATIQQNILFTAVDNSTAVMKSIQEQMGTMSTAVTRLASTMQNEFGNKVKKAAEDVHKAHKEHLGKEGAAGILDELKEKVTETVTEFAGLTAIEEIVRHSYSSFAEFNTAMLRVQGSSQATNEEMKELTETLDELSEKTGQTMTALVGHFDQFQAVTGMAGAQARETFKDIAEVAYASGANIDEMSRAAGAAINNLGVNAEELKGVLASWYGEVPSAMMGAFAQAVPRISADMEYLGFTGKNAAIEIGSAFTHLERSLGSPRLAVSAMQGLMEKMSSLNNPLGQRMLPQLKDFQDQEGGMSKWIDQAHNMLEALGAFNGDPVRRNQIAEAYGLDQTQMRTLEFVHKHQKEINEEMKKGATYAEALNTTMHKMGESPADALNHLSASLESVERSLAQMLEAMGANEALKTFAEILKQTAHELDTIKNGFDWLTKNTITYDVKHGFGVAPVKQGEGSPTQEGGMPGAGSAHRWLQKHGLTVDSAPDWRRRAGYANRGGGGGGEGGAQHFLGGDFGGTGGGGPSDDTDPMADPKWNWMRPSTNIEDNRQGQMHLVDPNMSEKEQQTKAVQENTEALHRLEEILDPSHVGGRGGGGSGGGASGGPGGGAQSLYSGGDGVSPSSGPGSPGPSPGTPGAPARGPGEASPSGPPPDGPGTSGGGGTGINREWQRQELMSNPALREELYRHAIGENNDPTANQAVMEEAANRADIRRQIHGGKGGMASWGNLKYFQGYRNFSAAERRMMDANFHKVFVEGSDISKGAIDNSSQGLAQREIWPDPRHGGMGRFTNTANFGGDRIPGHRGVESFHVPGYDESGTGEKKFYPVWRARQLQEAAERNRAASQTGGLHPGTPAQLSPSDVQQNKDALDKARQFRSELDGNQGPVKVPTVADLRTYRNRVARQQTHWNNQEMMHNERFGAPADIGLA